MNKNTHVQRIELPLKVGSRILLYSDVDIGNGGSTASTVMYEGIVEQYVPETGKLEMSDGTGRSELLSLIDEAVGYEVTQGWKQANES